MKQLHVCSLARLGATVERTGATHIVTLINVGTEVIRPDRVSAENHLFLGMNDIANHRDGYIAPAQEHLNNLLHFVKHWHDNAQTDLVIHCFAGVSRSTAAAFTTLCSLRPELDEMRVALAIRRLSPSATPNAKIIELADAALNRKGRMIAGLEAIGRGADAYEGVPFSLPIDDDLPE